MLRFVHILLLFVPLLGGAAAPQPPQISTLLNQKSLKKVLEDRETVAHASLDEVKETAPAAQSLPKLKKYSFYAAMLTREGMTRTHRVLTDYEVYAKLVPYIEKAQYDASSHLLHLEGGIWKWKLSNVIRFNESGNRWIQFEVVAGHFTGLKGDIIFESQGDKGTLVLMRGEQLGRHWPPAFIIEQGAQIIFEFTARRMRSYLESPENDGLGRSHELNKKPDVPEPRSHL